MLSGQAVFADPLGPASLTYRVVAGLDWVPRVGRVTGWIGLRAVDLTVQLESDGWRLDGRAVAGLERCIDLDFNFTPATNVLQLQRLDLEVGASAAAPAAWLDADSDSLVELKQTYARRSRDTYVYEAPGVPYAAELRIAPSGFVASYPGLWELEAG